MKNRTPRDRPNNAIRFELLARLLSSYRFVSLWAERPIDRNGGRDAVVEQIQGKKCTRKLQFGIRCALDGPLIRAATLF